VVIHSLKQKLRDQLKRMPGVYKPLKCCNSDKCNVPYPKLHPCTKVHPRMITATKEPAVTYRPEPAKASVPAAKKAKIVRVSAVGAA
jgi:hypothetical protein